MRTSHRSYFPRQVHALRFLCAWLLTALFLCATATFAQDTSHSGWVVIPIDEYQALRTKAYPPEREPEPPPVEATLTRVDYDLRVAGRLATGRASLTVDVLKDGWVRVPIPSGLLVREARLNGKLVSLVPAGSGKGGSQLSAVLSHPGRAVLLLDIALPVALASGDESIALPSSSSGVTRASVQLPRQGVDVKLSGGLLAQESEAGGESTWLVYARGNEPLTFTWRRKLDDHHATLPLRLRGSLTQLVGLGEDGTSIYAEVKLEVVQGAAREAKIQLPSQVTINQVSGAMVADWEAKSGALTVTFLEPVEQSAGFIIVGETRTPRDGKIEIPVMRLLDSERESGGVAVEVLGAGEIKQAKKQGLEEVEAADLGNMIASRQSPSLAAFRFRSGDAKTIRSLNVDVARYSQQAVLMALVEEARYQVLMSKEGKLLIRARYAVRNNQRNFLKIQLPAGAAIWSATLGGAAVRPGQAPDGSLLLPLEKSRAGEEVPVFPVEITYLSRDTSWTDHGKARLTLPALDLPISRTGLLLYYPPLFKVSADPGPFRTEQYEDPASVALNPTGVTAEEDKAKVASLPQSTPEYGRNAGQVVAMVEKFHKDSLGGIGARVLPISVAFPAFGPSIFLVSELTGENKSPSIDLTYQRDKKEGGR